MMCSINAQGVAVERALGEPTMSRFHAMFSIGGMIGASLGALLAQREVGSALHAGIASALFLLAALGTSPWLYEAGDGSEQAHPTKDPRS